MHVGFDDLLKLAQDVETEEDKLEGYRQVRDEIRVFTETLSESLSEKDDLWEGFFLISCQS